ncbi:MAG TPA: hypothetical protein DEG47_02535, partial [Cyanobacteria bacterium UBA11148]|nr:hypothetical protein [Cyanobacteria bacterium UBA11148]
MTEPSQEALWLTSTDCQQLFYVSLGFEQIWGRPLESLSSYPGGHLQLIADTLDPRDKERVVTAFRQKSTHDSQQDYRIIRHDGSIRWVRSRSFRIPNFWGMGNGE